MPVSRVTLTHLVVAMPDPTSKAREVLATSTGLIIEPVIASASEIRAAIARFWSK